MIRIMHIMKDGQELPERQTEMLHERGIECEVLSPTLFSAFTSVKIASALGKADYACIHAYNATDAMAAISARKISKGCQPKIILEYGPNQGAPKSIPNDLQNGVDAWIFSSSRQKSEFPDTIKRATVIPSADFTLDWSTISPDSTSKVLLWLGALDKNIDRMKAAIKIADAGEELKLVFAGTGKARFVMDAVRVSRGMDHPERVEWLGENFCLAELLKSARGIIMSQSDAIAIESTACKKGWALLVPENGKFVEANAECNDEDCHINQLTDLYRSMQWE